MRGRLAGEVTLIAYGEANSDALGQARDLRAPRRPGGADRGSPGPTQGSGQPAQVKRRVIPARVLQPQLSKVVNAVFPHPVDSRGRLVVQVATIEVTAQEEHVCDVLPVGLT